MKHYVKVAERASGGYWPLTGFRPIYRIGEVARASCPVFDHHRPPETSCTCGIYCATARSLAWVPYYEPRYAVLLVQPVGRALDDGHVVRSERLLVLGEIEDPRQLLAPPLRNLDWSRARLLLRAAAELRNTTRPDERVLQLHRIWRMLGRDITQKRCEAFWRAYRAQIPPEGCPLCRSRT